MSTQTGLSESATAIVNSIESLSLLELRHVSAIFNAEIEIRVKESKKSVIAEIHSLAESVDITVSIDNEDGKKRGPKGGATVPAKYKNEDGLTWTGRGLQPKWVKAIVDAGGNLDDYLVKPE